MGRKRLTASNPKQGEVEVGKSMVDRIVRKPTFNYFDRPSVGVEYFIFKHDGDSIEGVVISRSIANVRRNSSYAIRLDDGRVVEIFANKTLHAQLKECLFQRVRIVRIGLDHTSWGHAKKVYRVYRLPHGGGASLDQLRAKYGQKGAN